MRGVDDSDLTMPRMLQADCRGRLENIACEAGLSVATVQRRIRAFREADFALIVLAKDMEDREKMTHACSSPTLTRSGFGPRS